MSNGRFAAVCAALILTLVWSASVRTQAPQAPTGPPVVVPTAAAPADSEDPHPLADAKYVGAEACAACHREVHDTWKDGRHSKMLQRAVPGTVKGDFGAGSLILAERPYTLRVENGEYFITESYLTGTPLEHRIQYTLGSRRIQHYITTDGNGRMIILPPTWDVQRQEWFDNMEIVRPDQDEQKPVQQWNKNCFGCHVSQQENNYSPSARTYETQWEDFGTSCERCHGPGSKHIEAYSRAKDPALVTASAIIRQTNLDPATSSMICAQCHTFRDIVAPGFMAGANYYDYFLPFLEYGPQKAEDPAYWADGRPRRFSNDAMGLWQSECFIQGGATCTTCHRDPHLPDVDRPEKNPQLAASNNGLCTRCHQEIGAKPADHTRHAPDSAGSSCVECHMPKAVVALKASMRDHTMSLPTPENTVAFGIPNACSQCHTDRSAAWAVDVLQAWYPEGRRSKVIARAETFTAARAGRPEALDRLIAMSADPNEGPMLRANAVGYLANYPDQRAVAALLSAAKAEHPIMRATAVAGLGRIDAAASRLALLAALDDPRRAVRIPALMSIINRGARPSTVEDRNRLRRVGYEFAIRAEMHPDDAAQQRDLGVVRMLIGELDLAAVALQNSLELDPAVPSATFLLAVARLTQGRVDEAKQLLMQVAPTDPSYAAAQDRLKRLDGQR
jgi:hypothetical protein